MSGNGFQKLRRFCGRSGGKGARNGRILLCVAIAPYTGARIETLAAVLRLDRGFIAPLAGARIETLLRRNSVYTGVSHLV